MGFGYLLIGYLVAHLLCFTLSGLGFSGVALLVGCGLMFMGLTELTRYQAAFAWAKWLSVPLALCALYDSVASLDNLFLWKLPVFTEGTLLAFDLVSFVCTVLFNLALLYGVRTIAAEVGLRSLSLSAVRNMIIVGAYAVLMPVGNYATALPDTVRAVLAALTVLLNLVWIVCNLLLLLSCNKNICAKGDEEVTPRRSRFAIINRIGDTYEKNKQRTADSTREYAEELLRKRREKQNQKRKK